MKKLTLLSLICVVLLTSCHGRIKSDTFKVPEKFDTTQNYEITFWAKNDTNVTQVEIYHNAIESFEKLYPNIKINLKLYTDYGRIYSDVITNIATDTTPNVCITYPDHIATYMTGTNSVVPLTTLFEDDKYGLGGSEIKFDSPTVDEIIPKFLDECAFGDEYYALPFVRSTEACYVNRDFVEKLGYTLPDTLTWDFVWEVSEAAMEKDEDGNFKVNGQKVLIPFIYKSTDNMMISMLKQKGAGYSKADGTIEIFNDDTREILETVAEHAKTKAFSTFKISSYPANFLNAGQCIFAIDSTAGATWMGSNAPNIDISPENLVHYTTEVMAIPQYEIENPQMISQGPSMCIFNKENPQEVLASWLFMQFLLTNDVQIDYASTEGYAPVTSKAQNSQEYLTYLESEGKDNELYYDIKLKATKLLISNTENTFVTPVFNGSATLRNEAGQMIENVVKSARRKEVIDDSYFEKLFGTANMNVDKTSISEKSELGEMPFVSILLLTSLGMIWICIFVYIILNALRTRKNKR